MKYIFSFLITFMMFGCVTIRYEEDKFPVKLYATAIQKDEAVLEWALCTIDSLTNENERLTTELNDLKNGEKRLLSYIKMYYAEENFILAEEYIRELQLKHPNSPYLKRYKKLFTKIRTEAARKRPSIVW
jgi:hypothetical protein